MENHRQPIAGNLQIISVIEAINFVLLWKGNHLMLMNTHSYTYDTNKHTFTKVRDDEGAATLV